MQRLGTVRVPRWWSGGLRRYGNGRTRMLSALLLLAGLVAWQAPTAESLPQLLGRVVLWAGGLLLGAWITVIWRNVFSIRFDAD